MSRYPSVVAVALRKKRPVIAALVATVVPWKRPLTAAGWTPSPASSATAAASAADGSSGVDGTLATATVPSPATAVASVKVPPTSIATIHRRFGLSRGLATRPGGRELTGRRALVPRRGSAPRSRAR